ncbi:MULTISPECIES: flagellar hook protein FlgE [Shewanella]|uniref:flagellar hook protein FlgE n=1 Tax=Shewanella TaxID=22 RepID=UPI00217E7AD2|nr:flagellar hook protein FlgE [Shewanella baltica]MCS6193646.1 flagellar basal body protein FlaE [Shewanella baltica]
MSFNIALSGLQATTQDLNTISNNIANASTSGFRGGRSEFASIYNGGQAGGVGVMSTSQNFSKGGSLTYTGRQLDMGIQGEGFFVLKGNDGGAMYARAGMFHKDSEGFITDPVGSRLQGYSVNATGRLQTGNVGDLQVQTASLAAKATTNVSMVSNLDARVDVIPPAVPAVPFDPKNIDSYHSIGTTSVYDSLGTEHVVTQYYVKTAPNEWTVNYTLDGTLLPDQTTLKFDSKGILDPTTTKDTFDLTLSNGASPLKFDINFDKSTQYAAKYNNSSLSQDGYTSGELKGVRLDDNGMLYGTYTNGQDQLQGQVVLANFSNPNGLSAVSNNAWVATNTAGQAIIGSPSTGTMGTVTGGYLEGSNVDTTAEMVNLMSAQRNYQSNAKVLDVNSTMQQALLNAI